MVLSVCLAEWEHPSRISRGYTLVSEQQHAETTVAESLQGNCTESRAFFAYNLMRLYQLPLAWFKAIIE